MARRSKQQFDLGAPMKVVGDRQHLVGDLRRRQAELLHELAIVERELVELGEEVRPRNETEPQGEFTEQVKTAGPLSQARHLIPLEQAAKACLISPEALRKYAVSGHAPSTRIDGGDYLFRVPGLRRWVEENLMQLNAGFPLPRALNIQNITDAIDSTLELPPAIRFISGLRKLAVGGAMSGIYFVCFGREVVYIGQSEKIHARVGQHLESWAGDCDAVYFLPCPAMDLNRVEGAMIRLINPKRNEDRGPKVSDVEIERVVRAVSPESTTGYSAHAFYPTEGAAGL
jgi:hypothetical protein